MEPSSSEEEYRDSIAPDVMGCLANSGFFEKLDELLSPEDESRVPEKCDHSFRLSDSILPALGFTPSDLDDILAVLRSKGACCDCEVLFNISETNRLKAKYWRARARDLDKT
jgi:hypothetical protein